MEVKEIASSKPYFQVQKQQGILLFERGEGTEGRHVVGFGVVAKLQLVCETWLFWTADKLVDKLSKTEGIVMKQPVAPRPKPACGNRLEVAVSSFAHHPVEVGTRVQVKLKGLAFTPLPVFLPPKQVELSGIKPFLPQAVPAEFAVHKQSRFTRVSVRLLGNGKRKRNGQCQQEQKLHVRTSYQG